MTREYDALVRELRHYFNDVPLVMQAADAIEKLDRHGHWIRPKGRGWCECSVCGESDYLESSDAYCPACGAKMDEKTDKRGDKT